MVDRRARRAEQRQRFRLCVERVEQLLDDVVLVAEVVVEVARADLQLVGDVVGGDRRLALRVEHRKRAVEDALAGVAGHRGWAGQPASFFTRSTYFCFASSWPDRKSVV